MKLLIDNALSPRVAELLRLRGFDAVHVRELGMERDSDELILTRAAEDHRIVVSRDADFSGLLAQKVLSWPSFVHLRMPGVHDPRQQVDLLLEVFAAAAGELEAGAIVSMQAGRFRVRPLPLGQG